MFDSRDPVNCSPPGSSVRGVSQERMLEWVAISSCRTYSWSRNWTQISCLAGEFFTTEPPGKTIDHFENENESRSVLSDSLQPHRLYSPWNSPGQNTEVGSPSLLQGIFPTQGLNLGLPQILYQMSHQGSPFYWLMNLALTISSLLVKVNRMKRKIRKESPYCCYFSLH